MAERELAQVLLDWSAVFMRVSMRDLVRHVRETGLSLPQMNVLLHLYYRGDTEVLHLAEQMLGSPAGASQMVERLVQGGLVERREVAGDRRVRRVRLTEHGRAVVQASVAARQAWLARLVAALSEEEQSAVGEALALLAERAATVEESPPGGAP